LRPRRPGSNSNTGDGRLAHDPPLRRDLLATDFMALDQFGQEAQILPNQLNHLELFMIS
jgi:hypothetical protein